MTTTDLKVEGMSCEHCVNAVKNALERLPGVHGAQVDLKAKRAQVRHDGDSVDTAAMVAAIQDEGYEAEPAA